MLEHPHQRLADRMPPTACEASLEVGVRVALVADDLMREDEARCGCDRKKRSRPTLPADNQHEPAHEVDEWNVVLDARGDDGGHRAWQAAHVQALADAHRSQ